MPAHTSLPSIKAALPLWVLTNFCAPSSPEAMQYIFLSLFIGLVYLQ